MRTEAPTEAILEPFEAETYGGTVDGQPLIPRRVRWVVDAVVLGIVFGVLLTYFRLPLLLSHTTTTGGDTAGHIYPAWYLKTHLLPKGLIAGWSPGWYDGFPMFQFYFPLAPLIQALLSYALPYTVAFKLGTVLGTFFLPVAVYLMFRVLRFDFPTPIVGAVLSLVFLFMRSFSIYGGNIPSTLAGEYAFSLSLGLSLLFLALAYQVATEERGHPFLAALVLALTTLAHLIPVFTILTTLPLFAILAIRRHGLRKATLRLGIVFGLGFALSAFWAIPFEVRQQYTAHIQWIQDRRLTLLAPREIWVYVVAAASGVVLALFTLDRRFLVFVVPASTSLAMFALLPQRGRFFNARFLPYWYVCIILCAAYFIGMVTTYVMRWLASWRARSIVERYRLPLVAGTLAVGLTVGILAPSIVGARPKSYIDDWIKWNYEGFEEKATWPQLRSMFDAVRALPPGLVWWEPSPDYNSFGTPDVLYALPYFTGHPTMEGIYYESSVSTNYHFLMASELADRPFNPWPGLPYQVFNMERGIDHMEMYDVRYYIAWSARAKGAAAASARLQHVTDAGGFSIFELRSTGQVVVPRYQPLVLSGGNWDKASIAWFDNPDVVDVPLVRNGPSDWPRVSAVSPDPPKMPLPQGGEVMGVSMTDDQISFDTDAIGVPHLVRTSFFPNWRAQGAKGPYEVSPSVMMVIPTQRHVTLRYERTWAEWLGLLLTAGGILVLLIAATRTVWPSVRRRERRIDTALGDA